MNKVISLALLAGGLLLVVYGISANDSISGRLTHFFTGSPTDKTIWMLIGGIIAAVLGASGLFRSTKCT